MNNTEFKINSELNYTIPLEKAFICDKYFNLNLI